MAQEAYFVSKKDLLQWINTTLSLNLTKVEQVRPCQDTILCFNIALSWARWSTVPLLRVLVAADELWSSGVPAFGRPSARSRQHEQGEC